jgi:hypothetical protein
MAVLVRHVGSQIQQVLWRSWGGAPTTVMLRTRNEVGNPIERDEWRKAVELVTGVTLLTPEEEATDPDRADQTIGAAVGQLTRLGQSPMYPLVKAENIQYGFERNYYGLRWIGRAISATCVAVMLGSLLLGTRHFHNQHVSTAAVVAGIVIDSLILLSWSVLPSKNRIRLAGERYSRQLYQAVVAESRTTTQGSAS